MPLVNPIHLQNSSYIINMTGRYAEYDNVIDYTAHKMQRIIKQFAAMQRNDIATALSNALDEYAEGKIDIVFIDGWPNIYESDAQA